MRTIFVFLLYCAFVKAEENLLTSIIPLEVIQQFLAQITGTIFPTVDIVDSANVSEACAHQLKLISRNQSMALAMLDASSKFPYSGIFYASRLHYGNYDECMGIHFDNGVDRIFGKYCISGLVIPDLNDPMNINSMYKLATCTPNMCSAQDLISVARSIFRNFPPIFTDDYCTSRADDVRLSAANIAVIVVLGLLLALMIFSTFTDYYLQKVGVKCNSLILAFSLYTNMPKLIKTSEEGSDHIRVFDGMKVISMLWIVSGHGFTIWLMGIKDMSVVPVYNHKDLESFHGKMYASYIDGAHFAVDTFFFIGGFLVTYHYLLKMKTIHVLDQVKSLPILYIHRIVRISVPAYMLFVVSMWIFPVLGDGPVWKPAIPFARDPCQDYWWSYFLYIQNYYNFEELCLTHTWYLSADMQMFLVAPLLLIPITSILRTKNGLKKTLYTLLVLVIASIVLPIFFKLYFSGRNNTYDTHSRLVDYLLGISLAVFMSETKGVPFLQGVNEKLKDMINLVTWSVALTGMFVSLLFYSDAEVHQGRTSKAYYYVLSRTTWCVGLAWLVYSCSHGYGGIINWILCRPTFQVIGRLTYSMYLLHLLVIGYHVLQNRSTIFFSNYSQYFLWCGYIVTTFIISIFWTLAFESPVIVIEKTIFGKSRKSSNETTQVKCSTTETNQQSNHLTD